MKTETLAIAAALLAERTELLKFREEQDKRVEKHRRKLEEFAERFSTLGDHGFKLDDIVNEVYLRFTYTVEKVSMELYVSLQADTVIVGEFKCKEMTKFESEPITAKLLELLKNC